MEGASWRIGEKHLGVHAIDVERLQPLPRVVCHLRHFFPPLWPVGERVAHDRWTIAHRVANPVVDGPAVDLLALTLGLGNPRDFLAPFRGHAGRECIAIERGV